MLSKITKWFSSPPTDPSSLQTASAKALGIRNELTGLLDPGSPYAANGESVPRWPEHGAALVAATPQALLQTQAGLIDEILGFSPMFPADFERMVMPVFLRYASWVHLLPASEAHHHFGPGGLLTHGFEVASHSARIADGKQVGVEQPPSVRAKYQVRWKLACMLGGLFHDLGKPLVDCGATDPDRTMTWPPHAGDLYSWLAANKLDHYRIYWRSGPRHERHKPVGTAVIREIIGTELLDWLSDEPTQEVMNLLMMSIAQGRTANNLMSVIISQADSMSVEADLKRLAKRTQGSGEGGTRSAGALVMAELRKMIESNSLPINKPGSPVWVTTAGCFGLFPAILDAVIPELTKKQITGLPANRMELAQLLADNGFIEACQEETKEEKLYSNTWDLLLQIKHKDVVVAQPALRALKFTEPSYLFGNLPLPGEATATASPPFMTAEKLANIAASVQIVTEPQSAESALGQSDVEAIGAVAGTAPTSTDDPTQADADASAEAMATKAQQEAENGAAVSDAPSPPPVIEDRRNRVDNSVERDMRRERHGQDRTYDLKALLARVERGCLAGPAVVEILRRIAGRRLVWAKDACEGHDGLVVRYPAALESLGIPPTDILNMVAQQGWLVVDAGSDRKVSERSFPDGSRQKCLIFTGPVLKAWEAMREQFPQILEGEEVAIDPQEVAGEGQNAGNTTPARTAQESAPAKRETRAPNPSTGKGITQGKEKPAAQRESGSQPPHSRDARNASSKVGPGSDESGRAANRAASGATASTPAPSARTAPPRPDTAPAKPKQQEATSTGERASNGQAGPIPAANARIQKPRAPAVGAKLVEPKVPGAAGDILAGDSGSAQPKASTAPRTPKPIHGDAMGPPLHTQRAQTPRGKESVTCALISELDADRIRAINEMLVYTAEMLGRVKPDTYDLAKPEGVNALIRFYASRNEIRAAPLIEALSTLDNPALTFKRPDSMLITDIKNAKFNPDFKKPVWIDQRIAQQIEKMKAAQAQKELANKTEEAKA